MGGKKESICKQRRMIKCRCSDAESHEYDEYIRAKKLASWGKKFGRQNIGKIMHFKGREPRPNGQTRRGKTLFENYDSCKKMTFCNSVQMGEKGKYLQTKCMNSVRSCPTRWKNLRIKRLPSSTLTRTFGKL